MTDKNSARRLAKGILIHLNKLGYTAQEIGICLRQNPDCSDITDDMVRYAVDYSEGRVVENPRRIDYRVALQWLEWDE